MMEELLLKYNLLDELSKRKLLSYLEKLLKKENTAPDKVSRKKNEQAGEEKQENSDLKTFDYQAFKKRFLKSDIVWTAEDLNFFAENRKIMNEWTPQEW